MKYCLLFLLMILNTPLLGQEDHYQLASTFWINKHKEVIRFDKYEETGTIIRNQKENEDDFEFHMNKDTLLFLQIYDSFDKNTVTRMTDSYKLLILHRSDTQLMLQPISSKAIDYFGTADTITLFNTIAETKVDDFNLQKLKIDRSGYHLEIDDQRNVRLNLSLPTDISLRSASLIDRSTFGTYTGKLSLADFNQLKSTLLRIGFLQGENLNYYFFGSHAQDENMEITYNDSQQTFQYNQARVTMIPILSLIRKIVSIEKMKKVNGDISD